MENQGIGKHEARRARENRADVVSAFEACQRERGTRIAVETLLEWAAADNRSRVAVDLWDAAAGA